MPVVFLSIALLLCSSAASVRAQLPVDLGSADQKEVDGFVLTSDTLTTVLRINATFAAQLESDRSWRRKLAVEAKTPGDQTIAEAVRRLQSHARIVTWLGAASLEPRTYVVAQLALMQSAVANDNIKAGLAKPPKADAGALLRNISFVEANATDVRRFLKGIEQIATLIEEDGP